MRWIQASKRSAPEDAEAVARRARARSATHPRRARVAQDPVGDRVEQIADLVHQDRECLSIAVTGPFDEVSIHLDLLSPVPGWLRTTHYDGRPRSKRSVGADDLAPAFKQDHVAPTARGILAEPPLHADLAEPDPLMESPDFLRSRRAPPREGSGRRPARTPGQELREGCGRCHGHGPIRRRRCSPTRPRGRPCAPDRHQALSSRPRRQRRIVRPGGIRPDAIDRNDPSRAPRARASRCRSRCPRYRSAGPPASLLAVIGSMLKAGLRSGVIGLVASRGDRHRSDGREDGVSVQPRSSSA